jgi:hypothetical protein
MSHLMNRVLPRIGRIVGHCYRRHANLDDHQFASVLSRHLFRERERLLRHGVSEAQAVVVVHAATICAQRHQIMGLAAEEHIPYELLEWEAVRLAACDSCECVRGLKLPYVLEVMSELVCRYGSFR